ncbi:MAG: hypothetical protein MUC83_12500 [Pirellula sp.]|nr:hypothetical protein [Pirellula sp.]
MIFKRKRFRRHGSLLAQQLILIGVSGMLMMLAIKLIHQTLDFASIYQGRFNDQRSISLLSRHFRGDFHSARTTSLIDSNRLELTTLTGARIVYRIENAKVIREVWDADKQSNNEQPPNAAGSYRLGKNQTAAFSVESNLATLLVDTKDGENPNSKLLPHKRLTIRAGYVSTPQSTSNESTTEGASDER